MNQLSIKKYKQSIHFQSPKIPNTNNVLNIKHSINPLGQKSIELIDPEDRIKRI